MRKTRTVAAQYDIEQGEDKLQTDISSPGSSSIVTSADLDIGSLGDGCIVVSVNPLNSLESTEDHCGSPSPRSDGNTTDDSGIDSICDRIINEGIRLESERRRSLLVFALSDDSMPEVKSSPASKAKSVLQETYGSLKQHTTAMEHPWKRDFVLSQNEVRRSSSKENLLLLKAAASTESVKNKVKETVRALETKYGQVQIQDNSSPPDFPVYSTVNKLTKKNKKKNQSDTNQDDVIIENKEIADLSEITELLSNTNELLNRSSHLRASLTVSVKHPQKKTAQTTTFHFPMKKDNEKKSKTSKSAHRAIHPNNLRKLSLSSSEDETRVDNEIDLPPLTVKTSDIIYEDDVKYHGRGISWYERENLRVASKLEKERSLGGIKHDIAEETNSKDTELASDDSPDEEGTPFVRYNPSQQRLLGQGSTVDIRRSVRLPPKTVANLASKFDKLLVTDESVSNQEKASETQTTPAIAKKGFQDRELHLRKNDISKIIDTLNKLEDEAKRTTIVTSKSSPKRPTVTSCSVGRKSQRQKHGFSLASRSSGNSMGLKTVDLAKKNSIKRSQHTPIKKERDDKMSIKEIEIIDDPISILNQKTQTSCSTSKPLEPISAVQAPAPIPARRGAPFSLTDRYIRSLLGEDLATPSATSLPVTTVKNEVHHEHSPASAPPVVEIRKSESKEKMKDAPDYYEAIGGSNVNYLNLMGYEKIGKGSLQSSPRANSSKFGSRHSLVSSYDYVKSPSVCSYFSLNRGSSNEGSNYFSKMHRSASEDNISMLRYEPIEPVHLVTARPAIVMEDQVDSISYFYDDIGSSNASNGHNDMGLYESIAGSILNLARNKMGYEALSVENMYASLTKLPGKGLQDPGLKCDESEEDDRLAALGPQEVLSYTLEKWSAAHWSETRNLSSARSSNRSSERKSILSDKSDEWIDIEDDDEHENSHLTQNFSRSGFRASHRKKSQNRSSRMSKRIWNQAMKEASKPIAIFEDSDTSIKDSSFNQTRSTSATDEELYESIYEVIQPQSDLDTAKSRCTSEEPKLKPDTPGLAPGLTKLAEAAGKKMRKLRRNWSLKKNDISRSLSRIRKYSSGGGNGRPIMATQQNISIGTELRRKPSRRNQSFWLPDAKSVVRQHGGPVVGDGSPGDTTFYITLTIEQDDDEEEEDDSKENCKFQGSLSSTTEMDSRSQSISIGSSSLQSGSSKTPDSWTATSFLDSSPFTSTPKPSVPCPPRRKGHKQTVIRPTQAPPDPPPLYKRSHSTPVKPHFLSPNQNSYQPDSLLLCDSIREFSQQMLGVPPLLGSPCSEEDGSSGSDMSAFLLRDHLEETYTSSLFQTEPLYQFYDEDLNGEQIPRKLFANTETIYQGQIPNSGVPAENMYECIDQDNETFTTSINNNNNNNIVISSCETSLDSSPSTVPCVDHDLPQPPPTRRRKKKVPSRPSAMDLIHSSSSAGGRRSLWIELPEVLDSGILSTISADQKKLQEAMFEVITSEASYLKSLNVLIWHFAHSTKLIGEPPFEGQGGVICKRDHRTLFSDIFAVRQCSEKFLEDLEKRWQSSVLLDGLCDVVKSHAQHNFHVYIKYCSNQVYQDRILKKLRSENPKFVEVLRELESSPICQSLAMHSFLMLPMQRITRLPLLVNAIFNRLNTDSAEYQPCKEALQTLNKLVKECNESARNMERMEEMLILSQQLDFKEVKAVPLISASRWLVKRGDATRIWWKDNAEAKLTFGRRVNRQNHTLFLFTDLLIVAKRKSDESYLVVDYCPRNLVQLSEIESSEGILPGGKALSEVHNYLAWLTFLQNNENKTIEWLVAFNTECERRRWSEAVTPQISKNPEEKIYEDWDCPLVEAVVPFHPKDAGEIALEVGEKANVLRKLSDSEQIPEEECSKL